MGENSESITRIQWRRTTPPEIDVYTTNGFAGRLKGPQAAAFSKVISMGFAAAMGVVKEAAAHSGPATVDDVVPLEGAPV